MTNFVPLFGALICAHLHAQIHTLHYNITDTHFKSLVEIHRILFIDKMIWRQHLQCFNLAMCVGHFRILSNMNRQTNRQQVALMSHAKHNINHLATNIKHQGVI